MNKSPQTCQAHKCPRIAIGNGLCEQHGHQRLEIEQELRQPGTCNWIENTSRCGKPAGEASGWCREHRKRAFS